VSRDRRQTVLESALFSPDLTYAEKAYMVVVSTIRAEHVDGVRRHGSKAMGHDGKFSLHLDYLAAAMSATPNAVRKLSRSLARKKHLSLVHEGTFGRPTTWQALVVRGAKNGRVTGGEIRTPYGIGDWLIRGAESAPLTYRTPDRRNPAPTSGLSPSTRGQVLAAKRTEHPGASSENTACEWHGWEACPPDCANHPHDREEIA
jgi:hypothetical protein